MVRKKVLTTIFFLFYDRDIIQNLEYLNFTLNNPFFLIFTRHTKKLFVSIHK